MTNGAPPRRSIFSAVLLIGIGVLFLLLQMGVLPVESTWRFIATYWPALLIIWGIAKLVDQMAARSSGQTPPPALTGGEVVMLILLLMFGGAASFALRIYDREGDNIHWPWDEYYSVTEELPGRPVPANAEINVRTDRGDITVTTDDVAELRVTARKSVAAGSQSEAEPRAARFTAAIRETGNLVEIFPERSGGNVGRTYLHLDVRVPRGVKLTANTANGRVTIIGVQGEVNANSRNSSVEVRDAGGDVTIEGRGTIRVIGAGGNVRANARGSGEIEISDVKGEVFLQGEIFGPIRLQNIAKQAHFLSKRTDITVGALPGRLEVGGGALDLDNATGGVSLTTYDRDIAMTNVAGRVRIENRRGNIEVRMRTAPRDEIDITNERGTVELFLPENSAFELNATSRRGEVETDFSGPQLLTRERESQREATLEGKVGTGGPRVQIRTTFGTVSVRKGSS